MQQEHLQQILSYYVEDAKNHLNTIEQHLLNLQSTIREPAKVNELFNAARCGIVGGASLLPISRLHVSSIHQAGFCLVDCFNVFQQEGSVKVDQKLEDLLMQVLYALKNLIEPLRESSSLTDERIAQVMSEIESIRNALMVHLNGLVRQSRSASHPEIAIASDLTHDVPTLEDLESLIDELLLDESSGKSVPNLERE